MTTWPSVHINGFPLVTASTRRSTSVRGVCPRTRRKTLMLSNHLLHVAAARTALASAQLPPAQVKSHAVDVRSAIDQAEPAYVSMPRNSPFRGDDSRLAAVRPFWTHRTSTSARDAGRVRQPGVVVHRGWPSEYAARMLAAIVFERIEGRWRHPRRAPWLSRRRTSDPATRSRCTDRIERSRHAGSATGLNFMSSAVHVRRHRRRTDGLEENWAKAPSYTRDAGSTSWSARRRGHRSRRRSPDGRRSHTKMARLLADARARRRPARGRSSRRVDPTAQETLPPTEPRRPLPRVFARSLP